MKILTALLPALLGLLLISSMQPALAVHSSAASGFSSLAENLSRQLTGSLHTESAAGSVLIVNFVDLAQLHCTSRFGQLISERLRNLLLQKGWRILEARRGEKVKIEEDTGPFILSDQTKDLARKIHCSGVLVGTYLFHKGTITVNARLVSVPDNRILAAATVETACDPYIFSLLRPEGSGCPSPDSFIRIKPFYEEQLSWREGDDADIQEKIFQGGHL